MEEERKPRKTHIKIIHHHVHHYHVHGNRENDDDIRQKTIENKHRVYSTSHRTHRHHRHYHSSKSQHKIPNNENEPKEYNDNNKPFPDNDNLNDSSPPYEYDVSPQERPKSRKPKRIVTYYIPESPDQNPYDDAHPKIPNVKLQKAPKPQTTPKQEPERFPYPFEKLRYLKKHPLPENDEESTAFGYPNTKSPNTPPRRIRFIHDYEKYKQPRAEGYSYWTDIEAVLTQERMGGYNEIPKKQLPMMYPFTQMSPRKLPWDFSEVELVPTRPNKPIKPVKPKSFSYYEESILELIRIPNPKDRSIPIMPNTDEFEYIESFIKTCLWHPFKKLTELTRLGHSSNCLEFERSFSRIHLVLFPCNFPLKYENNPLPQTMVVHRCVTSGYDLIYLLKKIKKIKVSFLLCAADLGNEAIDYHPKCIPTQYRLSSLRENGFDSLFFREVGVESILILDSSRVVPLYACEMSYR